MLKRIVIFVFTVFLAIVSGGAAKVGMVDEPFATIPKISSKPVDTTTRECVYFLSDDEYDTVCRAVMAEAGGESYLGQKAVAQSILNACRLNSKRPIEIVKDYQYAKNRPTPTESVKRAVEDVFDRGEKVVDTRVTIFYAPAYCKSKWHESQVYFCTIGGHRFFIERKFANK